MAENTPMKENEYPKGSDYYDINIFRQNDKNIVEKLGGKVDKLFRLKTGHITDLRKMSSGTYLIYPEVEGMPSGGYWLVSLQGDTSSCRLQASNLEGFWYAVTDHLDYWSGWIKVATEKDLEVHNNNMTAHGMTWVGRTNYSIYVSPIGNDATGKGTEAEPFKTLYQALMFSKTIVGLGTTQIILEDGDYKENAIYMAGLPAVEIRSKSNSADKVHLVFDMPATDVAMNFVTCPYIALVGLKISVINGAGVFFNVGTSGQLHDCKIHGSGGNSNVSGVCFTGGATGRISRNYITSFLHGVYTDTSSFSYINATTIENCGYGIVASGGIVTLNNDVVASNNNVPESTFSGGKIFGGMSESLPLTGGDISGSVGIAGELSVGGFLATKKDFYRPKINFGEGQSDSYPRLEFLRSIVVGGGKSYTHRSICAVVVDTADEANNCTIEISKSSYGPNRGYVRFRNFLSIHCSDASIYGVNVLTSKRINVENIYCQNAPIISSDKNKKKLVKKLGKKYETLFDLLLPVSYKMKDNTSDRIHVGFIAQSIEEAMTASGISDKEFAGLIKSPIYKTKEIISVDEETKEETVIEEPTDEVIGYEYALRYEEFIPINTREIQKLKKENVLLKEQLVDITKRLAKLEKAIE